MSTMFASNAILAKARAMYGKRLKNNDYMELLSCSSVNEVSFYLKQNTEYASALSDLGEGNVHRGHLEDLLKKKLFFDFAKIGRYEFSLGESFFEYIISRIEIEQIMHSLMLLSVGRAKEYIYAMPIFFNKHTHIDLPQLSKMKTFKDFLSAIKDSKYYNLLKQYEPSSDEKINLTLIESSLYTNLYSTLFDIIDDTLNDSEKAEIYEMLNVCIDANNFVRIMRLKKYYHPSYEYIESILLPFGTLEKKVINDLIRAEDLNDALLIIKNTEIGKMIEGIKYDYLDEIANKIKFMVCSHNIRYSVNALVVMVSYVFLLEIEISNIINIVEGVRYKLNSEEIDRMLIYNRN